MYGFQKNGTLVDPEGRIYRKIRTIAFRRTKDGVDSSELHRVVTEMVGIVEDECGCHSESCSGARFLDDEAVRALKREPAPLFVDESPAFPHWKEWFSDYEQWCSDDGRTLLVSKGEILVTLLRPPKQ